LVKVGKAEGRGAPIEDPQALQDTLQALFEAESEFSIKVEGTSTLPYASLVQRLEIPEKAFVLKLVRPLPHELHEGAQFRMLFAVEDQRYEAIIALVGREAYLQYRFQLPGYLLLADRRRQKRYPFRPRENAYVIAQDSTIPGLGVAGPLMNISMGGLALRVDRALRLDDGMRVPMNSALFERGKGFTRIRVQDLPQLHLLEGRALVAHATEHGGELILGLTLVGLSVEDETALAASLAFREKMYRGGQPPRPGSADRAGRAGRNGADGEEDGEADDTLDPAEIEAAAGAEVSLTARLRRRTARLVLAMAAGPVRQALLERLRNEGYHRLEVVGQLAEAGPLCDPGQRRALPALLLADLRLAGGGDHEPLAAVRMLEGQLAELGATVEAGLPGGVQTVILCEEVDPTLVLAQRHGIRFLAYPGPRDANWAEALDALLG
jgi:hypothetical protein